MATVRDFILPTALTVTTFVVVAACGGDDDDSGKQSAAVVACSEAPTDCQKCKDDQGKVKCGPGKDCYSTASGGCEPGNNS
ncbi:MAG: hypothetical protein U0263_11940 [Polyangiaceae bacterium]